MQWFFNKFGSDETQEILTCYEENHLQNQLCARSFLQRQTDIEKQKTVARDLRKICGRFVEESLKLGKLNPVLFCANWENHYFRLIEKHIGPVFISKKFKHKK